ncbi:outer membrane protein [secondary endosymbiont of Heteropsylla cubana]|uniref:Translocation and assembly module subunit TamA n=1 Tax=secondary endosymbiont of Heteropsylla cubana TaxID=134287 RepID=J3TGA3_9ENTR|nr:autotransporter assembly complex family protein [secondary endosymbiont of Heteropsylla cubana]AFP85417.1 outer membrane protein [secondary endosymbiont of Heteropsylla cubana]
MNIWHNRTCLFFCILLYLSPAYTSPHIKLKLEGLSDEIQHKINSNISILQGNKISDNPNNLKKQVERILRENLQALGYYSSSIDFKFQPSLKNTNRILIVHVSPGIPIRIANVNVILRGEARQDKDYQLWVKNNTPKLGTILNHNTYDHFKSGLSSLAIQKGYFDATFKKHQLCISPERLQAYWDIDFNSGQRYRIRKIRFRNTNIRKEYLHNITKIKTLEYYSTELLEKLHRLLLSTNWFNSVVISPILLDTKEKKTLLLDIIVTPSPRNRIESSIGYETNIETRVKNTWNKPYLNSHGQSFQTNINLSAAKQSANIIYKVPKLKSPLHQYYHFNGQFKREDLNNTKIHEIKLHMSRFWKTSNGWKKAINLHWRKGHFSQPGITNKNILIYPGISVNRIRQHGELISKWGDSQYYSLDISKKLWGSDVDFIILQTQNIWIRTLVEKHRLIAKWNFGWIKTNDFQRIPPSLRFFAGGDRSIRGYKYKSLSPQDDSGKLTGGYKLATGSLEYQYRIIDQWWGAVFIDGGQAMNKLKDSKINRSAGIGLRWQSPIGFIKFDIASPIQASNDQNVQFYIGLDQQL